MKFKRVCQQPIIENLSSLIGEDESLFLMGLIAALIVKEYTAKTKEKVLTRVGVCGIINKPLEQAGPKKGPRKAKNERNEP